MAPHRTVMMGAVTTCLLIVSACHGRTAEPTAATTRASEETTTHHRHGQGAVSLQLGVARRRNWGSVTPLRATTTLVAGSVISKRMHLITQTCVLDTDVRAAAFAPPPARWILMDRSGRPHASLDDSRVGPSQPVFRADHGPLRAGTCNKERVVFSWERTEKPESLLYAVAGGADSTWTLSQTRTSRATQELAYPFAKASRFVLFGNRLGVNWSRLRKLSR